MRLGNNMCACTMKRELMARAYTLVNIARALHFACKHEMNPKWLCTDICKHVKFLGINIKDLDKILMHAKIVRANMK